MIYLVLAAIVSSNFNLDGMEWSFQSGWNEELIPFRTEWNDTLSFQLEWNGLSILSGMKWPFHSRQNGMTSFHSNWNGMAIPFRTEWAFQSVRIGVPLY